MKRRTFMMSSAAASMFTAHSLWGTSTPEPSHPKPDGSGSRIEGSPANIHENKLIGRNQNRSTVTAMKGVTASSSTLATMTGLDILKSGGNAVDAAIAMNAVLGVLNP